MKLHGGVVGVTEAFVFLDVHVVRKAAGGKLVRCNAILHPADISPEYTVIRDKKPIPQADVDPHSVIRRGTHVQVYIYISVWSMRLSLALSLSLISFIHSLLYRSMSKMSLSILLVFRSPPILLSANQRWVCVGMYVYSQTDVDQHQSVSHQKTRSHSPTPRW